MDTSECNAPAASEPTIWLPLGTLRKAAYFASQDPGRPQLNQVTIERNLVFATDSYAMAIAELPGEQVAPAPIDIPISLIRMFKGSDRQQVEITCEEPNFVILSCSGNSVRQRTDSDGIRIDRIRDIMAKVERTQREPFAGTINANLLARMAKLGSKSKAIPTRLLGFGSSPRSATLWQVHDWQVLVMPMLRPDDEPEPFTIQ